VSAHQPDAQEFRLEWGSRLTSSGSRYESAAGRRRSALYDKFDKRMEGYTEVLIQFDKKAA
jgi:hypothetical protein